MFSISESADITLETLQKYIAEARLTSKHISDLRRWLIQNIHFIDCIHAAWQLELLTGDVQFVEQHLEKIDVQKNTTAHYQILAENLAGLEIIKAKKPLLFFADNDRHQNPAKMAIDLRNKATVTWLIQNKFLLMRGDEISTMCEHEWHEGLEIFAEQSPDKNFCTASISLEYFYDHPQILAFYQQKEIFPFAQQIDSKACYPQIQEIIVHFLTTDKESEKQDAKLQWCIKNIPCFEEICKGTSPCVNDNSILFVFFAIDFAFYALLQRIPGLLDLKKKNGSSIIWQIFIMNKTPTFNKVFAFKKDAILDGINFCLENDLDASGDGLEFFELETALSDVSNSLANQFTILSLKFTNNTYTLVKEYIENVAVPDFCHYLHRNNIIRMLLLLRSCNTEHKDIFHEITLKFIGLCEKPPQPKLTASPANLFFFKYIAEDPFPVSEKPQRDEYTWKNIP